MSKKDDGGRAFPGMIPENGGGCPLGMTLRDYFAAQIMNGIISNADFFYDDDASSTHYAEYAYIYADSMLRVRQRDEV